MTAFINERNMVKFYSKRVILSILLLLGGLIVFYKYMKSDPIKQILLKQYKIEKVNFMEKYTDLYLITYADERFFIALQNLIGSVHFWEPNLRIVIYDIGMNENQVHEILNWKNVLYKKFNFSLYPPHMQELKKYAFKPIIWNETFHEYGYIFLQDAGQEFRNKIDPIRNIIQKQGVFSHITASLSRSKELTHPLTEKYLNIALQKSHCDGATMGFKKDHPRGEEIRKLIHEALQCSLVEQCIAPEGSNLVNHRYDQAMFTLLTQKYNFTCGGGGVKACSAPDPNCKLTEDPKQSNDIVLYSRRLYDGRQYTQFIMKEN